MKLYRYVSHQRLHTVTKNHHSYSDFVTILQLRVLGLITCKYHESPNENCESQNFGSRELLYCIVFVLFTVYVNSL